MQLFSQKILPIKKLHFPQNLLLEIWKPFKTVNKKQQLTHATQLTRIPRLRKMNENPKTSWTVALAAGGAAGTAVDVALFPLDTIKTRLQSNAGFLRYSRAQL